MNKQNMIEKIKERNSFLFVDAKYVPKELRSKENILELITKYHIDFIEESLIEHGIVFNYDDGLKLIEYTKTWNKPSKLPSLMGIMRSMLDDNEYNKLLTISRIVV